MDSKKSRAIIFLPVSICLLITLSLRILLALPPRHLFLGLLLSLELFLKLFKAMCITFRHDPLFLDFYA